MPTATRTGQVPPHSLNAILDHLAQGGTITLGTYTRVTVIRQKHISAWAEHGGLIREDGNGYRIRRGKGWDYIPPVGCAFLFTGKANA